MPYQIKPYEAWKATRTNEGLIDAIKNVSKRFMALLSKVPGLTWLGKKFDGPGSSVLNLYMRKVQQKLPPGVEVYPSKIVKEIVDAAVKEDTSVSESLNLDAVNEDAIPLTHPDTNIPNIDYDKFQEEVEDRILANKEGYDIQPSPMIVWGAPGIGKTQIVEGMAKKYDMDVTVVNLAQVPPDNLLLPGKDPETGKGDDIPAAFLPVYDSKHKDADKLEAKENIPGPDGKPKGGILFFDELSRAPKASLNAAISLIEDRRIQKWKMASKWIIIGAANREEDDENMFQFSSALGNRFYQVNLVPDLETWSGWASKKVDKDTGELIFDPEMIEFLKFNRDLFHQYDPLVSTLIFPSPRTWTKAAEAIATKKKTSKLRGKEMTMGDVELIVAGFVGKPAAAQYIAYLNLIKDIDPKTLKYIYTDQEKAALPKKEKDEYVSDATSAMITAIILDKRGEKLTPEQIKNFFDYAIRLDSSTWATILVRRFLEEHPYFNENSPKFDEAYQDSYDENVANFLEQYPGFKAKK